MKSSHLIAVVTLILVGAIALTVGVSLGVFADQAQNTPTEKDLEQYLMRYEQAYNSGDYAKAGDIAREALDILQVNSMSGGDPSFVSMFMMYESKAHIGLGEHDKADATLRDALTRLEEAPGAFTAEKQIVKSNIAINAHLLGDLNQAEQMYLSIIEEAEIQNVLSNLIMLRNNLSGVYADQARFDEAASQLEEAIEAIERQTPIPQQDLAYLLNNLAETVREDGKPKEAEAIHRRSLSIRQNDQGSDRRMVAASMINIAMSLFDQGELAEADTQLIEAIELLESLFPNGHPTIATALGNRAEIARAEGRFQDALQLERRALSLKQQFLPPDHYDLAIQYHNLGLLLIALKQFEEAESTIQKAIALREKAYSARHPYTLSSYTLLGWLTLERGDPKEAARLADLASEEIASSALLPAQGGVRNQGRDNRYDTYFLQIEAAWSLSNN